jgi:glucose-1-phosphate adenylyltransferase
MNLIKDGRPDIVIVFGADHVYRMGPRHMIDQHASNASAA